MCAAFVLFHYVYKCVFYGHLAIGSISVNSTLSHLQTKEIVICCWNAIIYQTSTKTKNKAKCIYTGMGQAKHTLNNDRETKWFLSKIVYLSLS